MNTNTSTINANIRGLTFSASTMLVVTLVMPLPFELLIFWTPRVQMVALFWLFGLFYFFQDFGAVLAGPEPFTVGHEHEATRTFCEMFGLGFPWLTDARNLIDVQ